MGSSISNVSSSSSSVRIFKSSNKWVSSFPYWSNKTDHYADEISIMVALYKSPSSLDEHKYKSPRFNFELLAGDITTSTHSVDEKLKIRIFNLLIFI